MSTVNLIPCCICVVTVDVYHCIRSYCAYSTCVLSVCEMFSPASHGFLMFLLFSFCPILSLSLSVCPSVSLCFSMTPLSTHHQAKVRELEEKCRTQSEQFNLLSKELEKFRLQAGKFDILSTEPLTLCESPGSPNKSLSQLLNGLAAPIGKGTVILMLVV